LFLHIYILLRTESPRSWLWLWLCLLYLCSARLLYGLLRLLMLERRSATVTDWLCLPLLVAYGVCLSCLLLRTVL